jgi:hypothetical protein
MTAPHPGGRTRSGRLVVASVAALVLAVLVVAALALSGGDSDQPGSSISTPSSANATAVPTQTTEPGPPAPVVPAPTAGGDVPPPVLATVDLDARAEAGDGVTATVLSVDAIDGTGYGPGNVAGPALRIAVRLVNGTDAPLALDGVAVELTTGAEATPASPLDDPSRAPFSGTVPSGGTAEGVYVFSVPVDQRDRVAVSVGYRPGAPLMVFAGAP